MADQIESKRFILQAATVLTRAKHDDFAMTFVRLQFSERTNLPVADQAPLSHEPKAAEEKPLDSNRADVEDAAHGEYR